MLKKIAVWISAIILSITTGVYLAKKQAEAPESTNWPLKQMFTGDNTTSSFVLSSNYEQELVNKINVLRQEKKLTTLLTNESLNKAALARLAVILTLDDYTGTASGLTREKSLSLVDYQQNILGDLFVVVTEKDQNPLEASLKNSIDSDTIFEPKFSEIGVAKIKQQNQYYFYFLLANKQKKVSAVIAPTKYVSQKITWGGPELWEAVNKRRTELGVGKLTRKDELCTIASIRLNQLLDLKKLDGHAGFQPVLDRNDLKWIGEKYNVSEYLAEGFGSPTDTVKGWENTLGHRSLLAGGEYVWGCIYSQNSFAVAITAY